MHQDEAAFGRLSDARRCWAPCGCRPRVRCSQVREYVYAFAAVSAHDGVLDSLVLPVANAETMSLFLAEVALRHSQEYTLMVVDGAGWHAAPRLAKTRLENHFSLSSSHRCSAGLSSGLYGG